MRVQSIAVLVVGLVVAPVVTVRADRSPRAVPVSISSEGAIVVPVRLAGAEFTFLLDTGSTRSIVSDRLVSGLGLRPVATTLVVTSVGSETRTVVTVRGISVESGLPRDLLAAVLPLETLHSLAGDIDGVLGQDYLLPLNYTLDYRRKRLRWEHRADCRGRADVALKQSEGRWLAAVASRAPSATTWLVPDTGAGSIVIFRRRGGPEWDLAPVHGQGAVTSFTGTRAARAVTLRELRLGDITLRDLPAVVVERDEPTAPEGDGLLPLHGFSSVSFDAGGSMRICR